MNGDTMRAMAPCAAMVAAAHLGLPSMAWACCPDHGKTSPKAASGLGEALPAATDLAADPAWQIYEFERDGLRYTQSNDGTGKVRAAVCRIGGAAWFLPIGQDADRVALPGDGVPAGVPSLLYRGADVEVLRYQDGTTTRWLIRPLSATE